VGGDVGILTMQPKLFLSGKHTQKSCPDGRPVHPVAHFGRVGLGQPCWGVHSSNVTIGAVGWGPGGPRHVRWHCEVSCRDGATGAGLSTLASVRWPLLDVRRVVSPGPLNHIDNLLHSFSWEGVQAKFTFSGATTASITVNNTFPHAPRFHVLSNGAIVFNVTANPGVATYYLATGLNPAIT
jgi:hypothetical protein